MDWELPLRPAELAENRLIDAIVDGDFPINATLPPERELAQQLGVTRPTLREALQRLARDGWIEIHHGRRTCTLGHRPLSSLPRCPAASAG